MNWQYQLKQLINYNYFNFALVLSCFVKNIEQRMHIAISDLSLTTTR